MISPGFLFEKGCTYIIRIWFRKGDDVGAAVNVGIGDEPSPEDIGKNLLLNISGVANTAYNEAEILYTHLGDDTKYIGIAVKSIGGRYTQNIFDTFSIEKETLSNQEFEKDFVSIVPNPVVDFFELKLKKIANNVGLKIYNSLGQVVIEEQNLKLNNVINVSNFSSGIYMAKIEDNKGRVLVKKIIIN